LLKFMRGKQGISCASVRTRKCAFYLRSGPGNEPTQETAGHRSTSPAATVPMINEQYETAINQ
jgi:hypothetical protein